MQRFGSFVHLLLILLAVSSCTTPPARPLAPLILVSIDGFRWDYLQKYDAPTLKALAAGGVHAQRLTPSFPSKTFPNHFTLATGLRPEHHGIVSNYFFDPAFNASFNKNSPADNADPRWWQQGEPIWITAEKQGVRSACYFWPGSEAEIHGTRPSFHLTYDGKQTSNQRVDGLLAWFDLPAAQRPRFGVLYLEVVDVVGHRAGPDSPETAAAVKEADDAMARLLAGLSSRGLRDQTNLVIVSDHGMSEQSADRVIFVEDLMNVSQVQVESTGPNGGVRPRPGTVTPAELAASIRAKAPPALKVYLREEVPAQFHYRDNPRIPPVVLVADDHWNIESRLGWTKFANSYNRGNHGWDPATPNMGALFLASGPAFRRGHELADVDNIHLYNLLCRVLGLQPAPNDGDDRLAREVLAR
ncbi:MAG: ectonucleotide pyrophosphatase/phosphodiesterase [bacterium]|nr:ectonucleotide pyrophosphatase/phosphodiesterase [bacterium]